MPPRGAVRARRFAQRWTWTLLYVAMMTVMVAVVAIDPLSWSR